LAVNAEASVDVVHFYSLSNCLGSRTSAGERATVLSRPPD